MQYTVLVCDDDPDIVSALAIYLSQENYKVLKAYDGRQAVEMAAHNEVHLILLDVMMPVMDGIFAAVKIRETSNVPIIFLSAKSEDSDRILGFNMGADDYASKPFSPAELLARVRAHLRRYYQLGGISTDSLHVFTTGGLIVDDDKKLVTVEGESVSLTAVEYNILLLLIKNLDRVFSSEQIYEQVWNEPAYDVSKTISVHVRHIREKIEINPKDPRYLKVVYGLGYKVVKI